MEFRRSIGGTEPAADRSVAEGDARQPTATSDARRPWWARPIVWLALAGVVFAVLGVQGVADRGRDLGVYMRAADELGTAVDLYRLHPDAAPYTYPHVVLLPFRAVQEVFEDRTVRILFGLGQGLAVVLLLGSLARIVQGLRPWQWALFFALLGRSLTQNCRHGQLSLWVAAWTTLGILACLERRDRAAGTAVGIASAAKLTPALFVPAFAAMGRWRAALWTTLVAAVAVLLVPWPFLGQEAHARHLGDFYDAMLRPLFFGADAGSPIWEAGSYSIKGTVPRLLGATQDDPAQPVLVHLSEASRDAVVLVWSAILAGILALGFWRARSDPQSLALRCALVTLAIALFSPLTRAYHLSGIALAVALFVGRGPGRGGRRVGFFLVCAAFLLALPLRQRNLLGEDLWRWLDRCGLMHLGLVGMTLWLALLPSSSRSAGASAPGS